MTRTTTINIDFADLQQRGQSAVTVIKLMMACNDITLSNIALGEWEKEQPNSRKTRKNSAGMYFVRTQIAHLHEGLKIIEAIRKDKGLKALVNRCDPQTKKSFKNLERFLRGGKEETKFKILAGRIRQNITFHYDENGKLIKNALKDRAAIAKTQISSITRGSAADLWHFKASDDIVASIVVRQIWGVTGDLDIRKETNEAVDYIYKVCLSFLDFSGEFIWSYCSKSG